MSERENAKEIRNEIVNDKEIKNGKKTEVRKGRNREKQGK
jgi:hypothetical protein